MGTHPIFESDFDCLTDRNGQRRKKRKENTKAQNGKKLNQLNHVRLSQEFQKRRKNEKVVIVPTRLLQFPPLLNQSSRLLLSRRRHHHRLNQSRLQMSQKWQQKQSNIKNKNHSTK